MRRQTPTILVKQLGRAAYVPVWKAMQIFTRARGDDTVDELWVVEHPPVVTQGLNGKPEHLLDLGDTPVVQTDRGGQVTYHGPGQVVIYVLIDVKRLHLGPRALVSAIENAIIAFLAASGVEGAARARAPGVYVAGKKIAALGLRIKRGCSYHGLAFNVDMDLAPFSRINPCGFPGLEVTQLRDHSDAHNWQSAADALCGHLIERLGYNRACFQPIEDHHVCQTANHRSR